MKFFYRIMQKKNNEDKFGENIVKFIDERKLSILFNATQLDIVQCVYCAIYSQNSDFCQIYKRIIFRTCFSRNSA